MPDTPTLREAFGQIDVYLFDQLLRGRIRPGMRILDAGCGHGRNLVYLLRARFDVHAADEEAGAIEAVTRLAAELAPSLPASRFRRESVEALSFDPESFDVVISNAVLHFAANHDTFDRMLRGTWRMVAPGGLFFCRLASSVGIESRVTPLGEGRFAVPDGSERYLVDAARLVDLTDVLGGELADPIKTTVVENLRSMTTWVVRRYVRPKR